MYVYIRIHVYVIPVYYIRSATGCRQTRCARVQSNRLNGRCRALVYRPSVTLDDSLSPLPLPVVLHHPGLPFPAPSSGPPRFVRQLHVATTTAVCEGRLDMTSPPDGSIRYLGGSIKILYIHSRSEYIQGARHTKSHVKCIL